MRQWLESKIKAPRKKALSILPFPSIQLLQINVRDFIHDSGLQAAGMYRIAQQFDTAAAVSLMDLSVEAECFGAEIHCSDDEVSTVTGCLVQNLAAAEVLPASTVGAGRTGIYLEAVAKALPQIADRPVLAGVICHFFGCPPVGGFRRHAPLLRTARAGAFSFSKS